MPRFEQLVDEPLVEPETARVDAPAPLGQHAPPRDGEAIRLQAERLHQRDIALEALVVIAGHVTGVAVAHEAGRVRETVPDARACAIGKGRAFDLVRGGRGAPEEAGRKDGLRRHPLLLAAHPTEPRRARRTCSELA